MNDNLAWSDGRGTAPPDISRPGRSRLSSDPLDWSITLAKRPISFQTNRAPTSLWHDSYHLKQKPSSRLTRPFQAAGTRSRVSCGRQEELRWHRTLHTHASSSPRPNWSCLAMMKRVGNRAARSISSSAPLWPRNMRALVRRRRSSHLNSRPGNGKGDLLSRKPLPHRTSKPAL